MKKIFNCVYRFFKEIPAGPYCDGCPYLASHLGARCLMLDRDVPVDYPRGRVKICKY